LPEPEQQRELYRDLARMYDELVGNAAFDCWRDNFERIARRNEIRFTIAADVACGTGLAAEYLSRSCERVYAIDLSADMLRVAEQRCGGAGVVLLQQGFTELSLPEQVDLLTCNFDSLNYLTDEDDLREALSRFGKALKPGGWAVFDMNTTAAFELEWDDLMLHRTGIGLSVWESSWDPVRSIAELMMTNFVRRPDGAFDMSEETHRERSYDTLVVLEALEAASFARVEMFDARGLSAVTSDTRRIQFVAKR
jgi:ubiquinone/menaquinone biosynthesis C-methylase UbiE